VAPVQHCPLGQQFPPQRLWPDGQSVHCPLTQLWPEAHARPQVPQLLGSDAVSTHVPLQSALPSGHWQLGFVGLRVLQVLPPLQASPQPLQFWSVPSWTHAPLQQACPLWMLHFSTTEPFEHFWQFGS
jgi:hypothetical protein